MTTDNPMPEPDGETPAETTTSFVRGPRPKDDYTAQMSDEWLDSLGEGARREFTTD